MAVETQSETSKIRPNHTQTPNVYFDQYMAFLTGEEWKCLCYAVRRTMGFQRPSAQISTVQYATGIRTKDGKQLDYGTGLSRQAVAKAVISLVKFGLLIEVKPPRGNAGGVYELQLDDTKIDHDAIMSRSTEQAQKKRQRTTKALQVRLTAVSRTNSSTSDVQGAVSATNNKAERPTNSNPVARKKEKESLGNKDSLQPAAGASVADAPEVAAKAVAPEAKRESGEAVKDKPLTPGKVLAAAAKKPKAPQPADPLFNAIGEHVFGAKDTASRAAVNSRIALIMNGDVKHGRCIGIIGYECLRQNRERNELDYNQLAADVGKWKAWHDSRKTFTVKDCVTVLDSWQEWRGNGGSASDTVIVEVLSDSGKYVEKEVRKSELDSIEWRPPEWATK